MSRPQRRKRSEEIRAPSVHRYSYLVGGLLTGASREWNVSRSTAAVIALLPVVIVLGTVASGLVNPDWYKFLTGEDQVYEIVQVLTLLTGSVFLIPIAIRLQRGNLRAVGALYLAGAVFMLFVAGEEISWGQRIFDLQTPLELAEINRQDEISVHNITGIETAFRLMMFAVGVYGAVVAPIVYARGSGQRPLRRLLIPHWILALYFAVPLVWRPYRVFGPRPDGYVFAMQEFNEVEELIVYLGIFLFIVFQIRPVGAKEREA